jgi:hypothetical protein
MYTHNVLLVSYKKMYGNVNFEYFGWALDLNISSEKHSKIGSDSVNSLGS